MHHDDSLADRGNDRLLRVEVKGQVISVIW